MSSMTESLNPAFEILKSIPFKETLKAIVNKPEKSKD